MTASSGTLVVKVDPNKPDKDVIAYAAGVIRRGGIVAFPTETVYGLAVNLLDEKAIEKLYNIKKRSRGKPFTVHVADVHSVKKLGCSLTKKARKLVKKFWPGPLTIILKSKGGKSIGFRMPDNKTALQLIAASRVNVIAPSANISGKPPPTGAREVLKDLDGKIDMLLDAGPAKVGVESTVIDITVDPPVILREGAISSKMLFKALSLR